MVKLVIGLVACALVAVAYAQEANIVSNTDIKIAGKKVPYNGNPNHMALHVSLLDISGCHFVC